MRSGPHSPALRRGGGGGLAGDQCHQPRGAPLNASARAPGPTTRCCGAGRRAGRRGSRPARRAARLVDARRGVAGDGDDHVLQVEARVRLVLDVDVRVAAADARPAVDRQRHARLILGLRAAM